MANKGVDNLTYLTNNQHLIVNLVSIIKTTIMKIATTSMLFFLSASIMAQERTTASGNEATGAGGTVSYSVGLVDYTFVSGAEGSVSEGVQQSYKVSGVGVEEWDMSIDMNVFPNPAVDYLNINLSAIETGLSYSFTDVNGKLIERGELNSKENTISLVELAPATYYFNLQKSGRNIRTYKIIKTI